MERQSVSSSNLLSIGYDKNEQILEVEFINGGVYQYSGVPKSIYDELMGADSHGTYLHENIRDNYPFKKT